MKLKVNRVVFVKHHAWYLSIVKGKNGDLGCYWSFHDRTGMTDEKAKTAFKREHFHEVTDMIRNNIQSRQPTKEIINLN